MRVFLYLITAALFTGQALAESPRCDLARKRVVSFTEDKPTDTVLISIRGPSCDKAITRIQIVGADGKVLYRHSEPLSNAFKEEINASDAREAIKIIYGNSTTKATKALPRWQPKEQYYDANSQELSASKAYYNKLRQQAWRTFSHQVGYEGWKVIAYDRELGKVVNVSSGSP